MIENLDLLFFFGYCIGYGLAVGITWSLLFSWWR